MTPEDKLLVELSDLVVRVMDNAVTAEEFSRLQSLLRSEPLARAYYFDLLVTLTGVEEIQEAAAPEAERVSALLDALAENEQTATAVILEKLEVKGEKNETAKARIQQRPAVSKLSLYALVFSSAALLMLLAYAFFVSGKQTGIEVAALMDSIEAKWSLPYAPQKGVRLMTEDEPIQLSKGFIKVRTDNGVEFILEAPAEFRFRNSDELSMNYGRVFVNAADAANGFTVQTRKSKIIDLGTQFGVYTDLQGDSELHVFEGKTVLIAALANQQERLLDVPAGRAYGFGIKKEEVRPIQLSEDMFAKAIDSQTGLVWRGQKQVSLADVVCGGNGFGTGDPYRVIDPSNGNAAVYVNRGQTVRLGSGTYHRIDALKYVDGVFVPDGSGGPVEISSKGTLFTDCPPTSGRFRKEITVLNKVYDSEGGTLAVHDTAYGYPYQPAISMHANMGITFDLDAIRNELRCVEIEYFESLCAIADQQHTRASADFWVLIDGQVRAHITGTMAGFSQRVYIPIAPTDHFLTLVTTDHQELGESDPIHSDRCFFGEPVLGLQTRP